MSAVKPGETERFDCEACGTEFEVTLEPKASSPAAKQALTPKDVDYCPFCGQELVKDDEEEASEEE